MKVILKSHQNMQFRLVEDRVKFRMNLKSLQEIMDVENQIIMIQPMIIVIVTHVVLENFVFVMIVKIQATVLIVPVLIVDLTFIRKKSNQFLKLLQNQSKNLNRNGMMKLKLSLTPH
jgi:hypothetical protein